MLSATAFNSLNISFPYFGGFPGRFLLPDMQEDALGELGQVLAAVHVMSDLWTAYGIAQFFCILMLIFRWVLRPCVCVCVR